MLLLAAWQATIEYITRIFVKKENTKVNPLGLGTFPYAYNKSYLVSPKYLPPTVVYARRSTETV